MPVAVVPSEADLRNALRAALGKLPAPATARGLAEAFADQELDAAAIAVLLEEETAAGLLFRYPAPARSKHGPRYWTIDLERLAAERLGEALTETPQTLAALKKRCGAELPKDALPAERWAAILARLCESGAAFAVGSGKSVRYASVDPLAAAATPLLQAMAAGPATLAQLKKATPKLAAADRQQALDHLVEAGRVFVLPPPGKSKMVRYSTTPIEPRQFVAVPLEQLLETLAGRLASAGVSRAEIAATASELCLAWEPSAIAPQTTPEPPDAATPTADQLLDEALLQIIYDRISLVEPAAPIGALVSIRELRRSLEFQNLTKAEFDHALLTLADRQRVLLHAHDFPGSLPPADRAVMVEDEQGHVYIGVMLNN